MNRSQMTWMTGFVVVAALAGCSREAHDPSAARGDTSAATADGSQFVLDDEPEGAADVIAVRQGSSDGDEVVVVGRIGGSEHPWVDDRAAFSIVDRSLRACSDIPGDTCPHPWDYCCETDKLPGSTALVKVVDPDGHLVKADARELLDLKELQTVVVRGKTQRDESGNLTVLADGIYIRD